MNNADSGQSSIFPKLGFGLGLRSDHYSDVLSGRASVDWFEVISENFMTDGGRPLHLLEKIRLNYPIAMHGVSLSIGSTDPLNTKYLEQLKALTQKIEPFIVSDHLCWTGVNGENLHDLLPLPFTEETLAHIASRILQVQDTLGRRILIENVSSYLEFSHSEMTEWEFLSALVEKADCGLLLDVNNIYVSSVNHGFSGEDYLRGLPQDRIGQIHLAGHSTNLSTDGKPYLIDTHDAPVCDEVWALYGVALDIHGFANTMVEWDANIPSYDTLAAELDHARLIYTNSLERIADGTHYRTKNSGLRAQKSIQSNRFN